MLERIILFKNISRYFQVYFTKAPMNDIAVPPSLRSIKEKTDTIIMRSALNIATNLGI